MYGYISKVMFVSIVCDIIIEGNILVIDIVICNDYVMFLVVVVGFEEKMILVVDCEEKNVGG